MGKEIEAEILRNMTTNEILRTSPKMTRLRFEPRFWLQSPFSLHYGVLTPEVLRLCSLIQGKKKWSKKQIALSLEIENCQYL